jgi:hypothetical protein
MIETNAILAISSLDRYTTANTNIFTQVGQNVNSPATQNYSLVGSYQNSAPNSNDFQITTPGTLTYGYISKIIVSQIQLQYNIPTVNFDLNAFFYIYVGGVVNSFFLINIPGGYYTPSELAAVITIQINSNATLAPYVFLVVFDQKLNNFRFTTQTSLIPFDFPDLEALITYGASSSAELNEILKTYKLLGIGPANSNPSVSQVSALSPDFLYTPYIDIYSNALTAYQKLSDGNSTVARPKGLIARVYLSGVGGPQITDNSQALGSRPFVVTLDLNSPKVIKWTKDVAINSLDFQMRDCYGELIPGFENGYQTEFQMTLLCIEGDQE